MIIFISSKMLPPWRSQRGTEIDNVILKIQHTSHWFGFPDTHGILEANKLKSEVVCCSIIDITCGDLRQF